MKTRIFHLLSITLVSVACRGPVAQPFSVIPEPAKVELTDGIFDLSGADFVIPADLDTMTAGAVKSFAAHLEKVSGKTNNVKNSIRGGAKGHRILSRLLID